MAKQLFQYILAHLEPFGLGLKFFLDRDVGKTKNLKDQLTELAKKGQLHFHHQRTGLSWRGTSWVCLPETNLNDASQLQRLPNYWVANVHPVNKLYRVPSLEARGVLAVGEDIIASNVFVLAGKYGNDRHTVWFRTLFGQSHVDQTMRTARELVDRLLASKELEEIVARRLFGVMLISDEGSKVCDLRDALKTPTTGEPALSSLLLTKVSFGATPRVVSDALARLKKQAHKVMGADE